MSSSWKTDIINFSNGPLGSTSEYRPQRLIEVVQKFEF